MPSNNMSAGEMFSFWANQGKTALVNYNFMLRVEGAIDVPCKAVRVFQKENEFEYIQEGGLNDYVHMRRKPISKPFTFQVERYVGIEMVDPMSNGTEFILPLVLFVTRFPIKDAGALGDGFSRMYTFTGAVVMSKEFGELSGDKSGLLVETTTIGYREMICIDNPAYGYTGAKKWGFDDNAGKHAAGMYLDFYDYSGQGLITSYKGVDQSARVSEQYKTSTKNANYSIRRKWDITPHGKAGTYTDITDINGDGSSQLYLGASKDPVGRQISETYKIRSKSDSYKAAKEFDINEYQNIIDDYDTQDVYHFARRNPTEKKMADLLAEAVKWDDMGPAAGGGIYTDISDKDGKGKTPFFKGKRGLVRTNSIAGMYMSSSKADNVKAARITDLTPPTGTIPESKAWPEAEPRHDTTKDGKSRAEMEAQAVLWEDVGPVVGGGRSYTDISDKEGKGDSQLYLGKDGLKRANTVEGMFASTTKAENIQQARVTELTPPSGTIPESKAWPEAKPRHDTSKDGKSKADMEKEAVRWSTPVSAVGSGVYTDIRDRDGSGSTAFYKGKDGLQRTNTIEGRYASRSKADSVKAARVEDLTPPSGTIPESEAWPKANPRHDTTKDGKSKAEMEQEAVLWKTMGGAAGAGVYTDISDRDGTGSTQFYKGKEGIKRTNTIEGRYASSSKAQNVASARVEDLTPPSGTIEDSKAWPDAEPRHDPTRDGKSQKEMEASAEKWEGKERKRAIQDDRVKSKADMEASAEKWEGKDRKRAIQDDRVKSKADMESSAEKWEGKDRKRAVQDDRIKSKSEMESSAQKWDGKSPKGLAVQPSGVKSKSQMESEAKKWDGKSPKGQAVQPSGVKSKSQMEGDAKLWKLKSPKSDQSAAHPKGETSKSDNQSKARKYPPTRSAADIAAFLKGK